MKNFFFIIFIIIFLLIIHNAKDLKNNSNGKILLSKKSKNSASININCIDYNGENLEKITSGEGMDYNASWSPEGTKIAFISNRETKSNSKWDIYIINENGSNLKRLTFLESHITHLNWSPDGTKIVFISNKFNIMDIFTININSKKLNNLTENNYFNKNPVWSPDGTKIAFLTNRDGGSTCYIMDSDGIEQKRLLKKSISCSDPPSWSPDGRMITCNYNNDIAIININDLSEKNITKIDPESNLFCGNPQWSPNGKWIVYEVQDLKKHIADIYLIDIKTLKSFKLTDGKWYIEPKWSPDSKNIFFFSPKYENDLYIYNLENKERKKISNNDLIDRYISIK